MAHRNNIEISRSEAEIALAIYALRKAEAGLLRSKKAVEVAIRNASFVRSQRALARLAEDIEDARMRCQDAKRRMVARRLAKLEA